jgi:uncharacterized membrane protein
MTSGQPLVAEAGIQLAVKTPQSISRGAIRKPTEYPQNPKHSQARLIVVDCARVIAILFMIQGHTLDVLLAPGYRQGNIFGAWLFLRGLTAPMFFTLSGVSFTLSSLKYWDLYTELSPKFLRRVRRFAFFVLLGYVMHLPVKSFHDFRYMDLAAWQGWLQVDVLQCIGVTLIFLQLLMWVAGSPERFAKLAAGAGAFVVLLAPVSWALHWTKIIPLTAASYLTSQTGSLFPLFPWSGYVLFGSALGYVIVRRNWGVGHLTPKPLLAVGGAMIAAGMLVAVLPFRPYGDIFFWTISPGVFLLKGGSVLVLLTLLSRVLRGVAVPEMAVRSIAQESLLIYFVHVCILYGCIWHDGLRQMIGATLPVLPTVGWIGALVISMLALAWTWNWYKRNEPRTTLVARTAVLALAIVYGLT